MREAPRGPGGEKAASSSLRWAPLLLALLVWGVLTFGHGWGLDLARIFFEWSKTGGTLSNAGGIRGMQRAELLLTAVFLLPLVGGLGWLLWRLRRHAGARIREALVPWLLWSALGVLLWRTYIVYASELVHFAQYAVIGALLCHGLRSGRAPQVAFLVATALGTIDEAWQHYGLHVWLREDQHHWLDWSDILLNAMGACGGILPFVTRARLRGEPLPDTSRLLLWSLAVAALVLLPLLLLDPVTQARLLGHYRYHPFWVELENHKAVHWPGPREGIPLVLGGILVVGTLVEPRVRSFSQGAVLVLLLLALVAVDSPSRRVGRPVHEVVPTVHVPRVREANIEIDGMLHEPAWERAARLSLVRDNITGRDLVAAGEASATGVRLLWDEEHLFVAFEVSDADIWAREASRDDPGLTADEGIQILIDDGGDEVTYVELAVSPANAVYDAFGYMPASPHDFSPGAPFVGLPAWDARGLVTASRVDGTLDLVERWGPVQGADADVGYVVEVALPWESLRATTIPGLGTVREEVAPQPGDRWRLGLHRVEWRRPVAEGPAEPDALRGGSPGHWLHLSWSPTHLGQPYVPARFGVMVFTDGEDTGPR